MKDDNTYNPLARFLVFCGSNHYPEGGMNDFLISTYTLDQAKDELLKHTCSGNTTNWAHIYDSHESRMVYDTRELS